MEHFQKKEKNLSFYNSINVEELTSMPKQKLIKILKVLFTTNNCPAEVVLAQIELIRKLLVELSSNIYISHLLSINLIKLLQLSKNFTECLKIISQVQSKLKKIDDKVGLIEVYLRESEVYYELRNIAKSRASLTSAKSNANSVYCPPLLQSELDLQSGILHAEELDFKTAWSYFYESFEGFASSLVSSSQQQQDSINEYAFDKALHSLKYMLLSKIMLKLTSDINQIFQMKLVSKFMQLAEPSMYVDIEAMKAVAKAHDNDSLKDFQASFNTYNYEKDFVINLHLKRLYDLMLEHCLMRLIEPYSRVQISYIADMIGLPIQIVEEKLSLMILDSNYSPAESVNGVFDRPKLNAVLDQGSGYLVVFEDEDESNSFSYSSGLELIEEMGRLVDSLYAKAKKL